MSLYHDLILDHFRNPRNYGKLKHATHTGKANNPTCGDHLHIDIQVKNGTIVHVGWSGAGCAISQASASLLTESIKGVSATEALHLTPADVLKLLGVTLSPNRLKCGLLSLETLHKTLLRE